MSQEARPRVPLSVIVTTRNEEANVERCLRSVHGFADQVFVLDSESTDRTVEVSRPYAEVHTLAYDHSRIIPWIFQWGLDNLPLKNDWVLILEADQAVTPELQREIAALLAKPEIQEDGFLSRKSDERFQAIYDLIKASRDKPEVAVWTARNGARLVRITDTDLKTTFAFDKRIEPEFATFIRGRLQDLYDEFRKQETE